MPKIIAVAVIGLTIALTACSQSTDENAPAENTAGETALDIHIAMKDMVDPHADGVWEVGNKAIDDVGGIDASAMDDAMWEQMAAAADALAADFESIVKAPAYNVAAKGEAILDSEIQGGITAQMVQAHIAKDPEGFRAMAAALQLHSADIAKAARAKDAARASDLVANLDPACEGCHLTYWYPELREFSPYAAEILNSQK